MARDITHWSAGPAEREWCLNLALSKYDDPVVGIDSGAAAEAARTRFDLFDVIAVDGKIQAYICASVVRHQPHSRERVMRLVYYHTTTTGTLAVRLLRYAHQLMVDEGRRRGLIACVSSSMNENWSTMYRVLALDGWRQAGGTIYYRLRSKHET